MVNFIASKIYIIVLQIITTFILITDSEKECILRIFIWLCNAIYIAKYINVCAYSLNIYVYGHMNLVIMSTYHTVKMIIYYDIIISSILYALYLNVCIYNLNTIYSLAYIYSKLLKVTTILISP